MSKNQKKKARLARKKQEEKMKEADNVENGEKKV